MTSEQLLEIFGVILALAFGYIPSFKRWFDALKPVWKPLVNAGLLLVLALALVGVSCLGFLVYFQCNLVGVEDAVGIWWKAVVINQSAYALLVNWPKKLRKQ